MDETYGLLGRAPREANRPDPGLPPPKMCKDFFHTVDTSRLLLAFLAFGAACTTLWAWMLATATTPAER
jgi:hypothetical protein